MSRETQVTIDLEEIERAARAVHMLDSSTGRVSMSPAAVLELVRQLRAAEERANRKKETP